MPVPVEPARRPTQVIDAMFSGHPIYGFNKFDGKYDVSATLALAKVSRSGWGMRAACWA